MYTIRAKLCEGGIMPYGTSSEGFPCTGSAHSGGWVIECTDPSHVITLPVITFAPNLSFDSEAIWAGNPTLGGRLT